MLATLNSDIRRKLMKFSDDKALLKKLRRQHERGDFDDEWEAKSDFQLLRESQRDQFTQVICSGPQLFVFAVIARDHWPWFIVLILLGLALVFISVRHLKASETLRSEIEDKLTQAVYSESETPDLEAQMGPSNFKCLVKLRKWRSDLVGDESDLRLLRDHQEFFAKILGFVVPLALLPFGVWEDSALWVLPTIVVAVVLVYWRVKVVEECRIEVEDILIAHRRQQVSKGKSVVA